jgi:hypothetical protein
MVCSVVDRRRFDADSDPTGSFLMPNPNLDWIDWVGVSKEETF